ncbi:hypothetical protein MKEN_00344500 [Mycena kentingensis (nom. inval.)]|nr:hypothetical protein MKEN_00344500 [Mycena kentingensis (nom. inval.)]
MPSPPSGTASSHYFSQDDPSFIEALNDAILPGDPDYESSDSDDLSPPPPGQRGLKRTYEPSPDPEPVDEAIYGEAHFGDFGEYMHRKRRKLEIQNAELRTDGAQSQIFKGLAIYVNGNTIPPQHEIRSLLIENGGVFVPYLDTKNIVTHIVTDDLTDAKIREWRHMKVVRPQFLTESLKHGAILPWRNFVWSKNTVAKPTSPRYAADSSNLNAQRRMADDAWRIANTAANPAFVKGYQTNSRLHFLSTTKVELQTYVREAYARKPVSPKKAKAKERVIMHCDFDSFFISVGLLSRPELRGKPVVVCHSQGAQGGVRNTSEIACASYEARSFGIKNGMSLQQAQKLCPSVSTMPYEFEKYKAIGFKFYDILLARADEVEAVSADEALVDVSTAVRAFGSAKELAESLRAEVKKATQCEVSIGIAHNILLARLATRKAKPAGSLHLLPQDVPALMETLDITDIRGFARSTRDKALEKLGSTRLKDLAKKTRSALSDALGLKTGETLYNAIRGIDDTQLVSSREQQSVSVEVNYGIRFKTDEEAETCIRTIAEEVANKLEAAGKVGRSITLKIMKRHPDAPVEAPKYMGHGHCEDFSKQVPLVDAGRPTRDGKLIGDHACRILRSFHFDAKELRGIGIQVNKLEPQGGVGPGKPNQQVLPFREAKRPQPVASTSKVVTTKPITTIRPPAPPKTRSIASSSKMAPAPARSASVHLPPREMVAADIWKALPAHIRQEYEEEWKRSESRSPFPGANDKGKGKAPELPAQPVIPDIELVPEDEDRWSPPRPSPGPFDMPRHPVAKQRAPQGRYPQQYQQQRPAQSRGRSQSNRYRSPRRLDKSFFRKRRLPNKLMRPTVKQLKELGIDPVAWDLFLQQKPPEQLIAETLARQRLLQKHGGELPPDPTQHKVFKPKKYEPRPDLYRHPLPKAKYPELPRLAQRLLPPADPTPQENTTVVAKRKKAFFRDTDDLQDLVEAWVNSFKDFPPEAQDIDYVARFLTKAMDSTQFTDTSVERVILVLKWWLVLLRRFWGDYEFIAAGKDEQEVGAVAEAWWAAFRDVKRRMDVVAKKKWGGGLAIR